MERNIDKIKRLENELGRYQKKVSDQEKVIRKLHGALAEADKGNRETQMLVDAVLTAAVIRLGETAKDPDTGEDIGWRLSLPQFSVREMREKYEIHARRDKEAGEYILGVAERKEQPGICPGGCVRNYSQPQEHCASCELRNAEGAPDGEKAEGKS